jgi:hypothetical protein
MESMVMGSKMANYAPILTAFRLDVTYVTFAHIALAQ